MTPATSCGERSLGYKNNLPAIFAVVSGEEVLLTPVFPGFPHVKRC
jgi:hypothetical protein